MTTATPLPVTGGNIWTPEDNYYRGITFPRIILAIVGIIITVAGVTAAARGIIATIMQAPQTYKTFVTGINTFHLTTISNPYGNYVALLAGAILATSVGLTMFFVSIKKENFFFSWLFLLGTLMFMGGPYFFTANLVDMYQQDNINSSFTHWLKKDHNLIVNDNLLVDGYYSNPTDYATQPRLVQDTKGHPTIVTFKVTGNTITFLNATKK